MEPTTWSATMDALTATFTDSPLDMITILLGDHEVEVALARTPDQWVRGFIARPELEAMLFIVPAGSEFPFHMRNVNRDLHIAFFNERGSLVDTGTLEAQVGFKQPRAPYSYALEFTDPIILLHLSDGLRFPEPQ